MSGAERRVLLIIGGGIAAYKALELIRLLRRRGIAVSPVLTRAGAEFVTPLSVQTLAESPVHSELFSLSEAARIDHIRLSREADLVVIAPATADLLAKMAAGLADDLASTLLLATDKAVLAAPAMNVRMWRHPATEANVATLRRRGVIFAGPEEGEMACGEYGPGRMAEPETIAARILDLLAEGTGRAGEGRRDFSGRHVLVTSGPTHEPIDPVRYLGNRSSGRQGHAIAEAFAARGARVSLISGPVALPDPPGVGVIHVETAEEMLAAALAALPADVAVCAAAVADWRVAAPAREKIKKSEDAPPPRLELLPNPDILARIAAAPARPALVIGFAAETGEVIAHAIAKRIRKGCDWIVANDVSPGSGVMGGEENTVHLITAEGVETWPRLPKTEVARRLVERVIAAFAGTPSAG